MLRCIAIDDEELALELLEDNIRKVPYLQLVASCSDPLEAIRILQEQPVDLVFLDIQMPGLSGLQFIQSSPVPCMFILITAYEKYALEGFNLNVVDYLVKPVELDRFIKACNKALELHQLRSRSKSGEAPAAGYLFVSADYSLLKIQKSDIRWIEGQKDYIRIHLESSPKPVMTRMSIKAIEEELPTDEFIRIHKSYIVSIHAITSVRKNSVFIATIELPISENYREKFFQLIGRPG
ncbi:LytTR family DNA-binding domain-containing protein [uncultured Chitinophaga sp.]|jgi:Response regulator of the LytR/AlgR family|uniref:LytR/AlgR family response regulator transcription factor n=1 Tax=uncultured Chitinophaga sp. TaxID=339340 RepID=UPI002615F30B|nr:LytTR family DNA-binding domain-containing protein [uncultured Chitinophaga sp.]